jgi:hypothetical protein
MFDTGPGTLSCIDKFIRTELYYWVAIFLSNTEKSKLNQKMKLQSLQLVKGK